MKTQIKNKIKQLWKDESAQGMTEYILLLVVIVGLVLIFKEKIKTLISGKLDTLEGQINQVNP